MDSPDYHPKKTQRSSSLFYSPATSEDEIIPKKFRRIRSRHQKVIRNSSDDIGSQESPLRYHTISSSKLRTGDDENNQPNSANNDVSIGGYARNGLSLFASEGIPFKNIEHPTIPERNESIWSYSSTTNRLLEDVEIIKELIFLRDIQLGFLPDDYEVEFASCFGRLSNDERFAVSRQNLLKATNIRK